VDVGSQQGAALLGNSDAATTGLLFKANEYGSDAFVSVRALNGTKFTVTDQNNLVTTRNAGTDVDVLVNGIRAVGKGLQASINTAALDLTFSIFETLTDGATTSFRIVGGGAQFQLGPDVVSNQQARLGIQSVNTAKLGGVAGRLFELRSGGPKSLTGDVNGAAAVVDEVISQITTLRGRLGAFQRTTVETNINSLNDALENLTAAESAIRDADFAAESAALTRAQILVQSGVSVLSIANQNPQAVLALLRQ
ncbi:MAG: flagellin, partial [Thermogutta sp.]